MILDSIDQIVFGRQYYYDQDVRYPRGVEVVIFERRESPCLVSGTLFDSRWENPEKIYILEHELSSWNLDDDLAEASAWQNTHMHHANKRVRRDAREFVGRVQNATPVMNRIQENPLYIEEIREELARFREVKDLSFFNSFSSKNPRPCILTFQSQPTSRWGPFDLEVVRKDDRPMKYNVTIARDWANKMLSDIFPDWKNRPDYFKVAWSAVLEWIDRLDPAEIVALKRQARLIA